MAERRVPKSGRPAQKVVDWSKAAEHLMARAGRKLLVSFWPGSMRGSWRAAVSAKPGRCSAPPTTCQRSANRDPHPMMSMHVTMHPIWQAGALVLAVTVAGALLLQMLAHAILPAPLRRDHTMLGAAIFSVIGTTYAVLLAFMATTAWSQYSDAQALATHEANLVGSLFTASRIMPDPQATEVRAALDAYLIQVIDTEWPAQIAGTSVTDREPLLTRLGATIMRWTAASPVQANTQNLMIAYLEGIETARRGRRLASHGNIPDLVWTVLLAGGVVVVCFSFMLGGATQAIHLLMTGALVGSGVLVLLLIIGLSSPFRGTVTIRPDAYTGVLAEIRGGS